MKIIDLNKFSDRVINSSNSALQRRVARLEKIKYEVFAHQSDGLDKSKFIFTVSIATYNRYEFLKIALNSVLNQTYKNIEIILIDQSGDQQVSDYCYEAFLKYQNIKLIRIKGEKYKYEKFKYFDDIDEPVINMWNAALFCSIGNCIYPLSDDDYFGTDFIERMVILFLKNNNCVTVGGGVQSVDIYGNDNYGLFKYSLARYTSASAFINNSIEKGAEYFTHPGTYYTVKSQLLIENGGWDFWSDSSPIFRIMIYGDFGYDSDAILYWRHHPNQAHWLNHGCIFYSGLMQWLKDYEVLSNIEKTLGRETVVAFDKWFSNYAINGIKQAFYYACESGSIQNILFSLREIQRQYPGFKIYQYVPLSVIVNKYLRGNLLRAYFSSNVAQKFWRKLKLLRATISKK